MDDIQPGKRTTNCHTYHFKGTLSSRHSLRAARNSALWVSLKVRSPGPSDRLSIPRGRGQPAGTPQPAAHRSLGRGHRGRVSTPLRFRPTPGLAVQAPAACRAPPCSSNAEGARLAATNPAWAALVSERLPPSSACTSWRTPSRTTPTTAHARFAIICLAAHADTPALGPGLHQSHCLGTLTLVPCTTCWYPSRSTCVSMTRFESRLARTGQWNTLFLHRHRRPPQPAPCQCVALNELRSLCASQGCWAPTCDAMTPARTVTPTAPSTISCRTARTLHVWTIGIDRLRPHGGSVCAGPQARGIRSSA